MSVRLPIVSNSRAKVFRRCPRLHFYTYVLGIRPIRDAAPLMFGDGLHHGLEGWWTAPEDFRLEAALDAIPNHVQGVDRVRAEELLTGYHARWQLERVEVLAVEQKFETSLVDPITGSESGWTVAGRLDAVIRVKGRVLIVEHKTTSMDFALGSPYWEVLRLDSQISTYLAGARSLGLEPDGVLYDVVGKRWPEIKLATPQETRRYTKAGALYANQRATDEGLEEYRERLRADIMGNPERYYARGEVVRVGNEIEEAALDLWHVTEMMTDAERLGRHPRSPERCRDWNRTCEFFDCCCGAADPNDATRFRRVEHVHEELA